MQSSGQLDLKVFVGVKAYKPLSLADSVRRLKKTSDQSIKQGWTGTRNPLGVKGDVLGNSSNNVHSESDI